MAIEMTVLVDNRTDREDLRTDHGLSILIAGPKRKLLFDTGSDPQVLLANAETLREEIRGVNSSIVSHGHYDHTGGLAKLAAMVDQLEIYAHPGVFARRWVQQKGKPLRDISCPHSLDKLCDLGAVFHAIRAAELVEPWLLLTGPIGGPRFGPDHFVVRKGDQISTDWFEDELAVLVKGRRGWVLVVGCCHRGLGNTLKTAKFLCHGEPIVAIVGGLHLHSCDTDQLRATINLLGEFGNPGLYPCHCTGDQATEFLTKRLGSQVHPIQGGSTLTF